MYPVIVVTELGELPTGDRWERLVEPLARELEISGLGQVLDYDELSQEAAGLGHCAALEIAVTLARLDYGRELVDRVLAEAGLEPGRPVIPQRWQAFGCEDYFSAGWAERGRFDEVSHTWVVVPYREAYEDPEHRFLVVGHSGSDGINFGYRKGHAGLWAHPIDGEFRWVAATVGELADGWCSGRLSL